MKISINEKISNILLFCVGIKFGFVSFPQFVNNIMWSSAIRGSKGSCQIE